MCFDIFLNKRDKVIKSFKKDFIVVKNMGFVESKRSHNTGIGKTFETLMNVIENNNPSVDYKGVLELKSTRELSKSMITLFTKAPTHPEGANTHIREKYGKPQNGLKIIHTSISGDKFNTFWSSIGFKLNVDRTNKKIFIIVKDLASGKIIPDNIYYDFNLLKTSMESKCKDIVYIEAEPKRQGNKEFFKFKKAILLTGLTFDKFLSGIEQGIIIYDIRIGAYGSGKNKGKTHDHGSGFRVQKNNINKVFNVEEI